MKDFKVGQYAVYSSNFSSDGTNELVRITKVEEDHCFVCHTSGCTAARVAKNHLMALANDYLIIETQLGHHRFDPSCPEYNPEVCVCCSHMFYD